MLFLMSSGILLAQAPANDSCHQAIDVLMDEVISFSTIDAETDGPLHPDSPCPSAGSDSIYNDIWYTHTATLTGQLVWDVCGTADFDTKIAVYQASSTCPVLDGDLMDCNEDGPNCLNATSELVFDVVMGETYIMRLGGFGEMDPGEEGSGTFTVSEFIDMSPPNNDCANAVEIFLGEDQTVNNINATTDGPDHPGNSACFGFGVITAQADVWYTFTPDFTGSVLWSTCDEVNFDSRLAVYSPGSACPPLDSDLMACNDDGSGCGNFTSSLFFDVEEGMTYLMRLGAFNNEQGNGTMDLINLNPPEPPANDLCTNPDTSFVMTAEQADALQFGFEGTTVAATSEMDFVIPSCVGNPTGEFTDVWFEFWSEGNSEIELRFVPFTTTVFWVDVFEDCATAYAGPDACFQVEEGTLEYRDTITGLPEGVNTHYFLRVVTWQTFNPPGDFLFQLVGENAGTISNVNEVEMKNLSIFPNPTSSHLSVYMDLVNKENMSISIRNMLGQTVLRREMGVMLAGEHTVDFDLNHVPPGVYLISMQAGDQITTRKFMKN